MNHSLTAEHEHVLTQLKREHDAEKERMEGEISLLRERLDKMGEKEQGLEMRLAQSHITIEFLEKQNKEFTSGKDILLHHRPVELPQLVKLNEAIRAIKESNE